MSDQPIRKKRRPLGYMKMLGLSAVIGAVVGGASALIDAIGGAARAPLHLALLAVSIVAVVWVCVAWWRSADEAVREAHKWAWYWGGSTGMAFVLLLFALSTWEVIDVTLPPLGDSPNDLVMTGVVLTVGAQAVGYLVGWAAWWLRRR